MSKNSTITITYGDQAENHVGMQKIGKLASSGLSKDDLDTAFQKFTARGLVCELIHLNEYLPSDVKADDAYILIVRNCLDTFRSSNDEDSFADRMFEEQSCLDHDTKAYMYGRVVNKLARHNLCFDYKAQEPDYEHGKGRIVPWKAIPLTRRVRKKLPRFFGLKSKKLTAEGNYYYNIKKCGIGFHGDSERRIVIAVRLGASLPLHYQWYSNGKRIGERAVFEIHHGDLYAMSEKATGCDWKKKIIPTLRHAAGCSKFTK